MIEFSLYSRSWSHSWATTCSFENNYATCVAKLIHLEVVCAPVLGWELLQNTQRWDKSLPPLFFTADWNVLWILLVREFWSPLRDVNCIKKLTALTAFFQLWCCRGQLSVTKSSQISVTFLWSNLFERQQWLREDLWMRTGNLGNHLELEILKSLEPTCWSGTKPDSEVTWR